MNIRTLIAASGAALALGLSACEQRDDTTATAPNGTNNTTGTNSPSAVEPDNTGRNERDRDTTAVTPGDQSESEADIRITAEIRRAIMDDDGMSTNAENCKIVTSNGVVTLRGPVDSQAEKDAIEAKARAVAGVTRVDNQLEVRTP